MEVGGFDVVAVVRPLVDVVVLPEDVEVETVAEGDGDGDMRLSHRMDSWTDVMVKPFRSGWFTNCFKLQYIRDRSSWLLASTPMRMATCCCWFWRLPQP